MDNVDADLLAAVYRQLASRVFPRLQFAPKHKDLRFSCEHE